MTVENIDLKLCNGCGVCVDSCTVDVLSLDTLVSERREYPPCRLACPAGADMRRYIHLLREGMFEEALTVLRETLPLPAVTGRICPHPCESECARKDIDEAVNINSLERYTADFCSVKKAVPARRIYAAGVAVIGSGPAGLAAAYDLVRMGYPVTVFESMSVIGGMLRVAVPEHRLPKKVLDAEIDYIRDMGVVFVTDTTFGSDLTMDDLKKRGYQAVFLALGAQLNRKLDIPGVGLKGVINGLDFLRDVSNKSRTGIEGRVTVIGGGNVAIDVALTALRLGAKEVRLACLESREEMPAYEEEIRQAVEEGVIVNVSCGPRKIVGDKDKKVSAVEFVNCTSVTDKSGRFNPCYDENTGKTIETDTVILAIGRTADLSAVPEGIKKNGNGTIKVDPVTLETTLPGVFAGGEITSAQGIAIEAIAAGKQAAVSIDRYLRGIDLKAGRTEKQHIVSSTPRQRIERQPRQQTPLLPVNKRRGNFKEVKTGYNDDMMLIEARRCTTCGSRAIIRYPDECMACASCEFNCPQEAIYVSPERHMPLMVGWR